MADTKKDAFQDYRDYLMMVGDIATHYAAFERAIDRAIWRLASVEERLGSCITTQIIAVGTRFKILTALMYEREMPESLYKEAASILEKAIKTSQFRNKFVHSPLELAIVDGDLVPMRNHRVVDKVLKDELVPYEKDDMQKTAARCQELKNEALFLTQKIVAELRRQSPSGG
jgi:hypothetical protein